MRKREDKPKTETEEINSALKKKALGFTAEETVEEYSMKDDGEIALSKKKVTRKSVPPDVTALKMLLDAKGTSLNDMTDEELEREKNRLLKLLKECSSD